MKRCRHRTRVRYRWHDRWVRIHGNTAHHAELCYRCGHWLPLGPSDEAPVAVEIRAAELAEPGALLRNGHEGNGRCDVGDDWYSDHDEYPDDWHAGYLARVIAGHGEDNG